MKRYQLELVEVGRDDDGDNTYDSIVTVTGSAASCRAVLAEIAAELGASGLQMTLGYGDAAAARVEALPNGSAAVQSPDAPQFVDAEPVKRTRRTKAQIEADHLAAEQAAGTVPETAPQPVDAPAPELASGSVVTEPIVSVPAAAPVPYNPFGTPAQ